MIGFQLGREYKLSVAEILTVFPQGETVFLNKDFLILSNLDKKIVLEKANHLGGTIKIVEILENSTILDDALNHEGKFKYGISIFGEKKNLKNILINQKKELKSNNISSRFINKDFKNLNSSQVLGEKLLKNHTDYNYIYKNNIFYFGKTIWIQDINSYSKRDWQKDRDMQTGMLPPKLCQIMINLAFFPLLEEKNDNQIIYDPFVGLGTVLIESILIGNKNIYGSDLNERMVQNSINNIENFIKQEKIEGINFEIIKLNAKFINESIILKEKNIDSIITEGYLGEIMTQKNISIDRINKQKESLLNIYNSFFKGLKNINYKGNIVICFPFWEMKGKYIFFTEIYEILKKYCEIKKIFPKNCLLEETKSGSLLYKRDKQLVGREIFKLKIK